MHHGLMYIQNIKEVDDARFSHLLGSLHGVMCGVINAVNDLGNDVNRKPSEFVDALEIVADIPYLVSSFIQLDNEEPIVAFAVLGDGEFITKADNAIMGLATSYKLNLTMSAPDRFRELISVLNIGDPKTQKLNIYTYTSSPLLEAHVAGEVKRVATKVYE